MKKLPAISVVIPLHQGEAFIAQTLSSVRSQTLVPFEVLIVDDRSRDRGPELARTFAGVEVIAATGQGPAAARQQAVMRARGTRIAFLDQDDYWAPGHLAQLSAALDDHPEAGFSCAPVQTWTGDMDQLHLGRVVRAGTIDPWRRLPSCAVVTPSCVMVDRQRLLAIGGWRSDVPTGDMYCYLALCAASTAICAPVITTAYRQSPGSNSSRLRRDPSALLEAHIRSVELALAEREKERGPDAEARARLAVLAALDGLMSLEPKRLMTLLDALQRSDCDLESVLGHAGWLGSRMHEPARCSRVFELCRGHKGLSSELRLALARRLRAVDLLRLTARQPWLWPLLIRSLSMRLNERLSANLRPVSTAAIRPPAVAI